MNEQDEQSPVKASEDAHEAAAAPQEDETTVADYIVELTDGRSMVNDGPLAMQCSKALAEIYNKADNQTTKIVLETQVVDLYRMVGLWQAIQMTNGVNKNQLDSSGVVYSVNARNITATDVVRFTRIAETLNPEQRLKSCLFIEIQGVGASQYSEYCDDLVKAAALHKVRVTTKLSDCLKEELEKGRSP